MKTRIITGIFIFLGLAVLFVIRQFVSIVLFEFLFFAIVGASILEVYKAVKNGGHNPYASLVVIYYIALGIGYFVFGEVLGDFNGYAAGRLTGVIIAFITMCFISLIYLTFDKNLTLEAFGSTLFLFVYPTFSVICIMLVSSMTTSSADLGLVGVSIMFAVSMLTDVAAYFTGTLIGGIKLCPDISPKKTVSGAIGGFVGGIIGAALCYVIFEVITPFESVCLKNIVDNTVFLYAAFGVVGSAFTQVGDLVASSVKRKCGIKDFGYIFPGHGGFMDRLDGLSFNAVLIYTVFRLIVLKA